MSLSRALLTLVVFSAALALSACGFEPMYGTSSPAARTVAAALPEIDIANIPDRDGQYLRNMLMDRLYAHGRPADAPYTVKFSPVQKEVFNMGVRKDATATRAQIQLKTEMKLLDKAGGKVLLQRELKSVGAYNILDDQLATMVSQQSITESLLQEISDNAVTEISLYFRRAPGPASAPAPVVPAAPGTTP